MRTVLIVLAVIVIIAVLRFAYAYINLVYKRQDVLNMLNKMYKIIQKHYENINILIDSLQKAQMIDNILAERIDNLKQEAITLGNSISDADRRIAYECEIFKIAKDAAKKAYDSADDNLKEVINSYLEFDNKVAVSAKLYNQKAQKLKTTVEVFPMSFIARLLRIKHFDFYRIV